MPLVHHQQTGEPLGRLLIYRQERYLVLILLPLSVHDTRGLFGNVTSKQSLEECENDAHLWIATNLQGVLRISFEQCSHVQRTSYCFNPIYNGIRASSSITSLAQMHHLDGAIAMIKVQHAHIFR